jgi:hypothetical protein
MSRDLEERAMRAEEAGAGGGCWRRFSQCDGEMKMRGGGGRCLLCENDQGFHAVFLTWMRMEGDRTLFARAQAARRA